MAKLFVSYSRKDSAAAHKLIEAFKSIQQDVWVDWESIPPAVDWLEQIFRGIEASDAFIFLISPDSIASEVCKVEINRAAINNKRIIPIVLRDVDPKITPDNIRKLNWTFIRETDNFEEGLAKVKTAIELDLDWLEEHRRLQVRSLEWHRKKDASLLLRGRDLRNARHMIATATAKDPIPTDLQKTFIEYSQRSERNRTAAWVATGIAVIAMAILSILAVRGSNEAQRQQVIAEANAKEASDNAILADQNRQKAEQNAKIASDNEKKAVDARNSAEIAQKVAEAQRSAARAQIYQTHPEQIYTSTLLAIDSWQSIPSDEAEEILRKNISLLPLPVAQDSQSGSINAIEFSPNGETFITAGADGKTCMWKIADGKNVFCAQSPQSVNDVAFSPDGTFIVTGDQSGLVQILDAKNGNVQSEYERVKPDSASGTIQIVDLKKVSSPSKYTPLETPVRAVSIRPAVGQQLAIAYDDGKIPVLDPKTGKISSPLEIGGRPCVLSFSPNGIWLSAGSDSGVVTVWNLSDRKIISGFKHRDGVLALAFSPNSQIMVTGGKDNTALVADTRTGTELFRLPNQNWVRDIAFSPDGSWLATGSDDHRIRVWDISTGKERLGMSQDSIVTDVTVSSNGQWIASTGSDKTARVWNASTGAEIFRIPLDANGSVLAFSNDDRYLVSSDQLGAIDIWDISVMAAPEKSMQFNGIVDNVQYSPSGTRLAVSDENRVWLLNPEPLSALTARAQGSPILTFKSNVKNLVFSPDSKFLGISTEGNEVAFYNIENRGLKTVKASSTVRSIAFSPDNQQFITSDADGNVQAWNILNAELISNSDEKYTHGSSVATSSEFLAIGSRDKITIMDAKGDGASPEIESLGENTLVALSADGSWLASSDSSGKISIWKNQNGSFTSPVSSTKEQAVSLSFNPFGTLLAVGTSDNVYLLDPTTGREIARIPHIDIVNGVSFSADGKTLATGSSKVLQFWDVSKIQRIRKDDLVPTACSRLVRNFDTAQWNALFGSEKYRTLCENLPVPQG
jgi:WD40 repeat protein